MSRPACFTFSHQWATGLFFTDNRLHVLEWSFACSTFFSHEERDDQLSLPNFFLLLQTLPLRFCVQHVAQHAWRCAVTHTMDNPARCEEAHGEGYLSCQEHAPLEAEWRNFGRLGSYIQQQQAHDTVPVADVRLDSLCLVRLESASLYFPRCSTLRTVVFAGAGQPSAVVVSVVTDRGKIVRHRPVLRRARRDCRLPVSRYSR